jgi:hypothetical protein
VSANEKERTTPPASTLAERIERDGFAIVEGVLDPAEVAALREAVDRILDARGIAKSGGTVLPNAAVQAPEISWILTHDRILARIRDALGCPAPMFTLEADLHRNFIAGQWHKDTGEQVMEDGYFGVDAFGRQDCRVVKVGIYLQDHGDGRGLQVRPGSHRSRDIGAGPGIEVASRAGDVVLFDVRISHRGVRPRVLDAIALGASRPGRARDRWKRMATCRRRLGAWTGRRDRMAVYFAFGIPNEQSVAFASRNMRRQLSQLGGERVELASPLLQAFAAAGVGVADMSACAPAAGHNPRDERTT